MLTVDVCVYKEVDRERKTWQAFDVILKAKGKRQEAKGKAKQADKFSKETRNEDTSHQDRSNMSVLWSGVHHINSCIS